MWVKRMQIINPLFYRIFAENDELVIPVSKSSREEIKKICEFYNELDGRKDYEIEIRVKRKSRSTDQIKYFWELLDQLAKKLRLPNQEVYQELLKDTGVFTIVPIKEDAIEKWISNWEEQGRNRGSYSKGWFCEDLGECKNIKGYRNIKCYYGIRNYSTEELSRVITHLEDECESQGILIDRS